MAAPVLSVTVPRSEVVPVCARAHVTTSSIATQEIRRLWLTEDRFIKTPSNTFIVQTFRTLDEPLQSDLRNLQRKGQLEIS
jgi:hypothetical protein